jgi:hypothetical protein
MLCRYFMRYSIPVKHAEEPIFSNVFLVISLWEIGNESQMEPNALRAWRA